MIQQRYLFPIIGMTVNGPMGLLVMKSRRVITSVMDLVNIRRRGGNKTLPKKSHLMASLVPRRQH
ncbi:hypothetical protein HK23_04630 [Acetobacter malorum]|uniref:Uncharacterized protein n=1 Tax=Acetobacter malorum TaxID=178901 RepID=A0A1Y3G555_9PROT|nr:hypothetical protein HK23_04630 [Acetobacter malorum]